MNEQNKKNIVIRLAFTSLLAILLSMGINKKVQADDDACPTCYKDDMDLEMNDSMNAEDISYSNLDADLDADLTSSLNKDDDEEEEVVLDEDEMNTESKEHDESLESAEEEMNEPTEEEATERESSESNEDESLENE